MKEYMLKKISDKSIVVGVVGLGYVGLPLAVERQKQGIKQLVLMFNFKRLIW